MSPTSGAQIPTGSVTIRGANLTSGGVQPIVDFGTVASIGSMTYGATQITATIPSAINPGTVNITVTTPAGTSKVSADDHYTYTGSGTTTLACRDQRRPRHVRSRHRRGVRHHDDRDTGSQLGQRQCVQRLHPVDTPGQHHARLHRRHDGHSGRDAAGRRRWHLHVCLTAANGVGPVATQVFTLTVYAPAAPPAPPAPTSSATAVAPPTPQHGYWLVGSDGGIFTFGAAQFYGSTGSLHLQRPVVGITPTANRGGYWLVASDGGIFAFGNAGYYGSIPGSGLNPAGSGLSAQFECTHRRHGALQRRRWVLHGGLGRGRLRVR